MGDFFSGWRGRLGVMTLATASLFMAEWVRSHSIGESVVFPFGSSTTYGLISVDRSILWVKHEPGFGDWESLPKWEQHEFVPHSGFYHLFAIDDVKWNWRYLGLGKGNVLASSKTHDRRFTFWIVPYWLIVIPLTILSAYLFLSMPHRPNHKKPAEPVSAERA